MDQPPPQPLVTMERMLHLAQYGMDSQKLDSAMDLMEGFIRSCLPNPPVSANAFLSADFSSPSGGDVAVDRVSALPDDLLRDVVSRLPAKDAARTAMLSSRWRPLWRSARLSLVDTNLLPGGGNNEPPPRRAKDFGAVTAAVSRVLEAHPGPFRCVALTCVPMDAHRAELVRWLHLLAVKGVEELVFVNRPWPLDLPFPAAVFSVASVTRLYLGVWRFPNTATLPRGAAFPNLVELGLGCVVMEDRDLEFVLARSPVLKTLVIYASQRPVNLRIVSRSLWCVQLCRSYVHNVAVEDAPHLERLFLWDTWCDHATRDRVTKVKIDQAPVLRIVGHLVPGIHVLEVGDTVIKVGTKASPTTVVPSVKILALKVHFEVRNEAKMVPSFLRCFPNVETLHVVSEKADQPMGKLNQKFWQENCRVECVQSHIRMMVFHEYRGERSELAFLKFILENGEVLHLLFRYIDVSGDLDSNVVMQAT
ncbi:hypothetical protein EJB05_16233, partial [Eragrostis curvula]